MANLTVKAIDEDDKEVPADQLTLTVTDEDGEEVEGVVGGRHLHGDHRHRRGARSTRSGRHRRDHVHGRSRPRGPTTAMLTPAFA